MSKYISLGEIKKSHSLIILTVLFKILNEIILFGINYNNSFSEIKLFSSEETQKYLSEHKLIHQIYCYFGTFIIALLIYNFESETKVFNQNRNEDGQQISTQNPIVHILIIIILWIIEELLISLYNNTLKDLDFWMVELLIISFLSQKILQTPFHRHQRFSIYLNLSLCSFKLISIFLTLFLDEDNPDPHDHIHAKILYKILYDISGWFIPLGILIYLILITLKSYVNVYIKSLMEHKNENLQYLSPSEILIFYGIIGTAICLIICIVTSSFECTEEKNIKEYLCKISEVAFNGTNYFYNNTSNSSYFDQFGIYFSILSYSDNYKEIAIEIFLVFLGIITFFFYKYFFLLVIKYLSPIHAIFSFSIYHFIQKIILAIYTLIDKHSFVVKDHHVEYIEVKYSLNIIGDIISLIGFMIYLEIIEL